MQCALGFGTIVKESMKGITSRSAKHYTQDKSYYPVPQSTMPLSFHPYFTFTSSETISKGNDQQSIKEWVENFRPLRQRTIHGETTKRQSRSPASPQPYCASKGNFFWRCHCTKETIAIAKKREICLASYAKCC